MRRTLLVVTRPANLNAALRTFRGPRLRILEAQTGLAALLLCACRQVDLAIMDMEAPGMDWPKLIGKLSAAFPALPVLGITSRDDTAALSARIREALESPATRKQPGAETVTSEQISRSA